MDQYQKPYPTMIHDTDPLTDALSENHLGDVFGAFFLYT